MSLSANVFVTLASQQRLPYHCKALFETLCTAVYGAFHRRNSNLHRLISNAGLNNASRPVPEFHQSDTEITTMYFLFVVMKWAR
jgi:hypothetical protein